MTEAKTGLLAQTALSPSLPAEIILLEAERRSLGKQLHQGILQELTVAGLRLKLLQDAAPEPTAAALAEFAAWLRERQAELRRFVSELEQGRHVGDGTEIAAIAAIVAERYGCQVTIDPQLSPRQFGPGVWSAMIDTVTRLAAILADSLAARRIDIGIAGTMQPTLLLAHDGRSLADSAEHSAAARTLVGRGGATLQIDKQGARERLTLDWTD